VAKPVTPAPARRGRPPADVEGRRAVIVQAARAVFARHGLEAASMRLIAKEAGVAAPTLYLYFSGAEELYGAALSASLEDLGAGLRAAAALPGGKRERAGAVAHAFFDFYYARPDDAALGLYLGRGLGPRGLTAELDAQLNRELLEAIRPLAGALREFQSLSPRAADTAAFALASSAMGVAIFHHTRRDKGLRVDARAAFAQLLAWVFRA
jgi:AcrR family transcriptional regulator